LRKFNIALPITLFLGLMCMLALPALPQASTTPAPTVDSSSDKLHFTKAEQDWLAQKHVVRVRVGDYAPVQFFNKKPSGIAVDYLNAIARKTGIQIEYRMEINWADTLIQIRDHKGVDLLLGAVSTEERRKYLTFTDTYLSFPSVIFTREDSNFVSSPQDLTGKIVAVQNEVVVHNLLIEEYPTLKLLLKDTEKDALLSLVTGESDAYVGNLTVGSYYIQTNGWNNVKVAAPTGFDPQNLSMAVRSDWPELAQIINKSLTTFTPTEHAILRGQWSAPIRYEYGISGLDILKWVGGISFFSLIIFMFILVWNRKLKTEITERKRIEDTLKKSEQKLKSIFRAAPTGIGVICDRVIQQVNDRFCEITGYSKDELTGQSAMIVYPSEEEYENVGKEKYKQIKNKGTGTVETKFKRKDGKIIDILLSSTPIDLDNLSKGVTFTALDITYLKTKEFELLESEEKYRSMMESMKDASYICSPELYVEYMNPAMIERVGSDVTGERCYKAIYERDKQCSWCVFDQIIKGENVDHEVADPLNNRFYSVSNSPVFRADGALSKLTIFHDITEIKNIEAQLRQSQKMESLGTLSGGIAHDFNNLLYVISGNTELALEDIPKWNPVHTNLEEIKSASLRAAGIVRQLLDFGRRTDQKLEPIGAVTVIKDALKFLRSTIPTTIDIRKHLPDVDITIRADPIQINQVMMNLCINASQAMEETGGILEINADNVRLTEESAERYLDLSAGDYLKITVSDTGPGIAPEIIDQLFDPYFTTKETGKGSGLGLSIVHGIVKSHEGAVSVESKLGKGTTFDLLFPVVAEKPKIETETIDEILRGHETILFVDDEESITDMTKRMLERLGYKVETSNNPVEALDSFLSKPDTFDLVISDMTMPQMTGVKLFEKLREIRSDIPVIICTGHSSLVNAESAKQLGVAGYVKKPVSRSKIAKAIRKALDKEDGE